jgi:isopenicillin-N epimerase
MPDPTPRTCSNPGSTAVAADSSRLDAARAAIDPAAADPSAWMLDPRVVFLNHGSFGARARIVFDRQGELREAMEAEPVDWLDRRRNAMLDEARSRVCGFLGVPASRFGFLTNASAAINAVLRSLSFMPGEEILTTDHAYGAVLRLLEHVAARTGARLVIAPVAVPVTDPEEVVAAIAGAMGHRTRLLVVDHVTSPTATVFPVARIVRLARERCVPVLVDGAHAPGMLELDVASIGADWYAGNLHKWVGAPIGAAFLHAAEGTPPVHPPVISHFHHEPMATEFSWQGTRDFTPWIAAPTAIDWLEAAGGGARDGGTIGPGWDAVRHHNRLLAAWAGEMLAGAWGTRCTAPPSMRGSMATIELPPAWQGSAVPPEAVRDRWFDRHRVEVPVMDIAGRRHVRISAHLHNRPEHYTVLRDLVLAGPEA